MGAVSLKKKIASLLMLSIISLAFGTANIAGTVANNTGADMEITATEFAAGDHLIINSVAGTAAATPVVSFVIEYHEIM